MRFVKPNWFWKAERHLSIRSEKQLKAYVKVIDDTVLGIIGQSLKNRKEMLSSQDTNASPGLSCPGVRKDIVSLFLDYMSNDGKPEHETEFDSKFLRDIVANFLIASRDTTAQALSWFLYCLSQNLHAEQKIREDLAAQLPELVHPSEDNETSASPSMEQLD